MAILPLHGFDVKPDLGKLKRAPSEYENLQNVRASGDRGQKREGIAPVYSFSSGVMGIWDLKTDDDPTSNNKVAIWTRDGTMTLFELSEIISSFEYLIDTGITLYLQSPDLNWWSWAPNSSGLMVGTVVAAPSSSQSTDFNVAVGQLFGFEDATGIWRLKTVNGFYQTQRYALAPYTTLYSTTLSIATGAGIVFEETNLNRVRISTNNAGSLITTVIA